MLRKGVIHQTASDYKNNQQPFHSHFKTFLFSKPIYAHFSAVNVVA